MKRKRLLFLIIAIVAIPTLIWISALIKCEVLTQKYYDDFEQTHTQNTMLGEMEYFKVLSCDGNTAKVYYVSKDMAGADVLTFQYTDGLWHELSWETIWSTSGSASKVVYPYWWHFIYGGL